MRFLSSLIRFFYALLITFACCMVILFVAHSISIEQVEHYLQLAYDSENIRWYAGIISGALILLTFLFERIISNSRQKERTIAFDNPMGRVSVSLTAVEDLVRRLVYREPEIKEVRTMIIATKRGLQLEIRMILKTEVNIPDMTARLQEMIKNKIQETLGVDEPVTIRIHVVKISSDPEKPKRGKDKESEPAEDLAVPFQGYRN